MANASVWTESVPNESKEETTEESSEETEDTASNSEENAKQNGSVGSTPNRVTTDRFGFTGGNQYTSRENEVTVPIEVMRKREVKWLDMLENWEKWMSKRFKKVKERCRKGVPPAIRPRAWQFLCGSKFLMEQNKGRFEEYIQAPGEGRWVEDIRKDLHRQFPFHEMFMAKGGHGQEDLFNVLKAYTVHNPTDGYCQAQAPIAAVLLMHMPAEQAFWCLVSVCEKYLPGYYSPGLEAVQTDGDVLFGLLKRCYPATYKHLKKHRVEPILYMTEWFMCIFSRTLPWSSVLRIWDMFFCEGVKVMFRVALVLVRSTVGRPEQMAQCPGLYETLERVRKIPVDYMREDYLTNECLRLPVTERDMEKEHQHQLARRRAQQDKNPSKSKKKSKHSTSPPPPR